MNLPQKYGREVFELLLDTLEDESDSSLAMAWHVIRDDGVYLRRIEEITNVKLVRAERDVMTWHPLHDLSKPALPFPFTARELAAFCFPGYGSSLIESYEDGEGLDPEKLAAFDRNGRGAAQVLVETHALLLDLIARFFPAQERDEARVAVNDAQEDAESKDVKRKDIPLKVIRQARRKAMRPATRRAARLAARQAVRDAELQEAALMDKALSWLFAEPAPKAGKQIPIAALSGSPAPIRTSDMGAALEGVGGRSAAWWTNRLRNVPKWAEPALAERRDAPYSSTWNPITLAPLILDQYELKVGALKRTFARRELEAWQPDWVEFVATYFVEREA